MLETYPVTLRLIEFGVSPITKNLLATLRMQTLPRTISLDGAFEVSCSQSRAADANGVITFDVYASPELNQVGVTDAYYLLTCQSIAGMRDRVLWVPIGGGDVSELLPTSGDGQNVPAPLLATRLNTIQSQIDALQRGHEGDLTYRHVQSVAATTWTINHNLHKFPSVTVADSAGTEIWADVQFPTDDQAIVIFSVPFSGEAYCN